MRIAHFVLDGAVVGGVERYLADLLAAPGGGLEHRVVLAGGERCAFAGRWPVTALPWSAEARHGATDVGALARDLSALGAVCLFHYPPSEAAVAAARRAGAPVAVFCHDHRWWCPSSTRFHALPGRSCGIRASAPACALRYYPLRCGGLRPGRMLRGFALADLGRETLAGADVVLAASAFMAEESARHGARVERTHVVPLPTAFAETPLLPAATATPPILLFASRLTREKGVASLLEAFGLMRETAVLEVAGTGIAAAAVARAAARHPKAERIRLLGRLDGAAMRDAYARAAAVVVPSLWPEPFGLVGIEALAAGRPVVTTGVGGMADWAREELGVATARPGGADFAAALDRVIAEPGWAERAREAGARWARERHSVAAHAARLAGILGPVAAPGV